MISPVVDFCVGIKRALMVSKGERKGLNQYPIVFRNVVSPVGIRAHPTYDLLQLLEEIPEPGSSDNGVDSKDSHSVELW